MIMLHQNKCKGSAFCEMYHVFLVKKFENVTFYKVYVTKTSEKYFTELFHTNLNRLHHELRAIVTLQSEGVLLRILLW